MSFLGSMFSDSQGSGFQAQGTNIAQPTTSDQVQNAYGGAQSGLAQQQGFLNALAAQQGIANQSNVYNQYQGIANGTGPNPAMAQLNQTTGQNVANQSAMMAGQRGANANVGLLARQAAQQGAATQQQAVGQGATLQANQSLAALGQMGSIAGQQVGQQATATSGLSQAQQQEQANLLGGLGNQNSANVTMQGNINNANAGIANTNAQGQQAIFGGALSGISSALANGGMVQKFDDGGGVQSEPQAPAIDSMITQPTFTPPVETAPTAMPIAAPVAPAPAAQPAVQMAAPAAAGPQSNAGQFLAGGNNAQVAAPQSAAPSFGADSGAAALQKGFSDLGSSLSMSKMSGGGGGGSSGGGGMSSMMNPMASAGGGDSSGGGGMSSMMSMLPMLAMAASKGGPVPGKAAVPDNSPKNDTVPAMLSPGEIVIPRSITEHPDAARMAAQFVAKTIAEHKAKSGNFDDGGAQAAPSDSSDSSDASGQPVINVNVGGQGTVPGAPPLPSDVMSGPGLSQAQQQAVYGAPPKSMMMAQNADQMTHNDSPFKVPVYASNGPATPPKTDGQMMPANNDPYGFDAYGNALTKGIGEQKAGLFGEAKDVGAQGNEQAQALQSSAMAQQQLLKNYQTNYNQLDTERQKWMSDIQNQKVDPNRFMSSMGTGQRVSTAIGLILGGMGGGLLHQKNPALEYLNDQINRDIAAQQTDLGKKENLLSANMKQFGNIKDATDMTRVMLNDAASMQLKQIAAKYQGKIEGDRALAGAGQIDSNTAQALSTVAARRSAMSGMAPGQALPAALDPALDRRVEMSGQTPGQSVVLHAPDKDTADKIRPQLAALDELQSVSSRISDFNKNNGTTYGVSKKSGLADSLNREMDAAIAHAQSSGGQIGRLVDKFSDMRPSAGAFLQDKQAGKLQGMANFIAAQKAALIRNNLNTGPAFGK